MGGFKGPGLLVALTLIPFILGGCESTGVTAMRTTFQAEQAARAGRHADAIEMYRSAFKAATGSQPEPAEASRAALGMARSYRALGNPTAAITILNEALPYYRYYNGGDPAFLYGPTEALLAEIYAEQGNTEEVVTLSKRMLGRRNTIGFYEGLYSDSLTSLAQALAKVGRKEDAILAYDAMLSTRNGTLDHHYDEPIAYAKAQGFSNAAAMWEKRRGTVARVEPKFGGYLEQSPLPNRPEERLQRMQGKAAAYDAEGEQSLAGLYKLLVAHEQAGIAAGARFEAELNERAARSEAHAAALLGALGGGLALNAMGRNSRTNAAALPSAAVTAPASGAGGGNVLNAASITPAIRSELEQKIQRCAWNNLMNKPTTTFFRTESTNVVFDNVHGSDLSRRDTFWVPTETGPFLEVDYVTENGIRRLSVEMNCVNGNRCVKTTYPYENPISYAKMIFLQAPHGRCSAAELESLRQSFKKLLRPDMRQQGWAAR